MEKETKSIIAAPITKIEIDEPGGTGRPRRVLPEVGYGVQRCSDAPEPLYGESFESPKVASPRRAFIVSSAAEEHFYSQSPFVGTNCKFCLT